MLPLAREREWEEARNALGAASEVLLQTKPTKGARPREREHQDIAREREGLGTARATAKEIARGACATECPNRIGIHCTR